MPTETRVHRSATTVPADASVERAAHVMNNEAVGCLTVLDGEGRAVGMLTDRDLALRVVGRTCDPTRLVVADVMSPEVVSVSPQEDLESIVSRMKTRGVRRVPVLEDGKPVGMVSLDEVLQTLARELHDLGAEARQRYRHADASARYEHLRRGTEHRMEEIGHRLAFANWFARKSFVKELDHLRERVRKAVLGD